MCRVFWHSLARVLRAGRAFTHPSRGAPDGVGRCTAGVASLDPRLISSAPSGQVFVGVVGGQGGRFFSDEHAAGGQTGRFVPTGRGSFALLPAPSRSHPGSVDRASSRGREGPRAAGPRASHRSDSPTPARRVGSGGLWPRKERVEIRAQPSCGWPFIFAPSCVSCSG